MTFPPLRLHRNNWRSRWLVNARWKVLHRISDIEWNDQDQWISGRGITICGQAGEFRMPGIFSRMELRRCEKCCKALGIPAGDGAPMNALKGASANV